MKTRRVLLYSFLLLLAFFLYLIVDLLIAAGYFKVLKPHSSGKIIELKLHHGPEDITIDQEKGIAFISCDDRWNNIKYKDQPEKLTKGVIYMLNLNNPEYSLIDLSKNFKEAFHPHGISLFHSKDGRTLLFVINHRSKNEDFVEIFEFVNNSLVHIESIQDKELMTSPNDLVAVGERQFYVSNDHGTNDESSYRMVEDYLRFPWSYVNYYDGQKFTKVADGISYANGINSSADGKNLYVSSTTGRSVFVYERDLSDGSLKKKNKIFLNTGVDNIEVDKGGNLWIGCHPKMLAFLSHAKKKSPSPSQIIKVNNPDGNYSVEEIYLNEGNQYSGSSVTANYNNKYLVGGVFVDKILVCELK